MQIGKTSNGDILFEPFKKITDHSSLIKIYEYGTKKFNVDTIAVIYKNKNKDQWNLMCNIGNFHCNSGILTVTIENTGYDSNERESKLFASMFPIIYKDDYTNVIRLNFKEEFTLKRYALKFAEMFEIMFHKNNIQNEHILLNTIIDESEKQTKLFSNISFCFNNRLHSDSNFFDDFTENFPTLQYLDEQYNYMQSLSTRLQKALLLYSHNGDRILNNYVRNNQTVSRDMREYYLLKKKSFDDYEQQIGNPRPASLNKLLLEFYKDMKLLFKNAPKVDKDFIVYRGSKTSDHFNGTKNNIYVDRGFCSTSLNAEVGFNFSGQNYISKIHITKGSTCLYNAYSIYPYEYEIILNDETYFLVTKEFQKQNYMENVAISDTIVQIFTNECVVLNE